MSLSSIMLPERQIPETQKALLDSDIARILSSTDLPNDTKYQLYQNVLHQYKQMQTQLKKPLQLDFVYKNEPQFDISTESFPRTLKQKAKNLINFIKHLPDIVVGDSGELIYKNNPIRGSNFVDLVHDFVRNRKRTRPPVGARELALALAKANVPKEFIGNINRWQLIDRGPNFFSSSSRPPGRRESWTSY